MENDYKVHDAKDSRGIREPGVSSVISTENDNEGHNGEDLRDITELSQKRTSVQKIILKFKIVKTHEVSGNPQQEYFFKKEIKENIKKTVIKNDYNCQMKMIIKFMVVKTDEI